MILSAILTFLGCKSEENKFLEKHKVILCTDSRYYPKEELTNEAIEFERIKSINFKKASDIYVKYEKKNSIDSNIIFPSLIIDEYYVYSFKNIKMSKVATFGVWINANTGAMIHRKDNIWLYEKDIIKKMNSQK